VDDVPADIIDRVGVAALTGAVNEADVSGTIIPLGDVTILAPVPRPGKIICVGANYLAHAEEEDTQLPDYPNIFAKFPTAVLDPERPIVIPAVDSAIDWEGELCAIIGRRGIELSTEEALGVVAGWTVANDVSARTWQLRVSQWTLGKSFDTFCPIGPWMATLDEIPDPAHLDLQTRVNGRVVQSSNTSHMVFSVPELISYISAAVTLEPGDLILTGTPGGVGHAMNPPRYLAVGDQVEVEIERIGVLRNRVDSTRMAPVG
jgi:2-keto-4-pentenoate hydratase/2-oxohepta-3-ene-1,7-dioic acid hydratase in catechol pathway